MNATINVPRSPLTIVVVVASLLAALIAGGVGGYLVKGMAGPSVAAVPPAAAPASIILSVGAQPSVYEQGGRPRIVYEQAGQSPYFYVQGGRPQVVYSQAEGVQPR